MACFGVNPTVVRAAGPRAVRRTAPPTLERCPVDRETRAVYRQTFDKLYIDTGKKVLRRHDDIMASLSGSCWWHLSVVCGRLGVVTAVWTRRAARAVAVVVMTEEARRFAVVATAAAAYGRQLHRRTPTHTSSQPPPTPPSVPASAGFSVFVPERTSLAIPSLKCSDVATQ